MGEVVELAPPTETLTAAMERALSSDNADLRAKRTQIASQNTWDMRVEQLSQAIERTLDNKMDLAGQRQRPPPGAASAPAVK
jgi:hypothetical protein